MSAEHPSFFADPHSWVLFSAVIFAVIVYIKGKKPVLEALDGRTKRITNDLAEAARLKDEAQALLADYQKKHRDAVQTAQKIIDGATEVAIRLQKESETKLEETLKRRETQLLDRLARAETNAIQELRQQAADIATAAAQSLLQDAMGKRGMKLVDDSIGELPRNLN
jgi:F-type H+-transporting ATPase subunit b